ncbi:MAG: autoinducer 2 ABC transporter substrate-binding protein [Verrucomicrobiales bacterium]|nr:autoinducer 2 ABC transporter substrate-binding protein [Verrucomicrobiales bacterium]MCP5525200.1 autoinducer 2 ABC transporter substrate-binding protein [Verrucomicrobiales bacterium]
MKSKTLHAPLLALLCGLFPAGCRKAPAPPSETTPAQRRFTIATVVKLDGIAWFNRMQEGVRRFAGETGHDCFQLGPPRADAALQVQLIEDLISQGVDAICVVPFSVEALEPVLKKARRQGIVVVAHEASNLVSTDLIIEPFDNAAYGAHLMDHLARYMGETGEFAVFVGSLTSKSHNQWIDAALARQQAAHPQMKPVRDRIEEYDDQNTAYQKTLELLKAFPALKGIQGSASTTAAGAGLAVEERGLQHQVNVVGSGLVSQCRQYLESGSVKLISFWDPADAGYVMNRLAVRLLESRPVTEGDDLGVEGYRRLRRDPGRTNLFYGSAWVDVTTNNMAQYPF